MKYRKICIACLLGMLVAQSACKSIYSHAVSLSPNEVVVRLLPVSDDLGNRPMSFRKLEEVEAVRAYLSPELFDVMREWVIWRDRAISTFSEDDNEGLMRYWTSENLFTGSNWIPADVPVAEEISGNQAVVTVVDHIHEKGDDPKLVSTTVSEFYLTRVGDKWLVGNVARLSERYVFPASKSDVGLLDKLREDIVRFKATVEGRKR